jgi:LacI family transcriptional regulator
MPSKKSETSQSIKRVTLVDVAKDAEVSRATASLVLRNSPLVADSTRQRVQQSMQKLGYVYNRGAARLRTQQSFSIGLVVTSIVNPFFAELTIGAEGELEQSGYVALLANTSDTASKQSRFLETVLEHGVDGVLLCPAKETPIGELEHLSHQIPIVQFVRSVPELDIDYVGYDNVGGTVRSIEHLIEHGHQRIAFIGGPIQSSAKQERVQGYMSALEKHGFPLDETLIIHSPVSRSGGRDAVLNLLEVADPPTAAICYNDIIALGVMMGLQSTGRIPGKDFAVVGFDDIEDASSWIPRLTTISGDARTIGKVAVNRLLQRIKNPNLAPTRILLESELVIRESCGSH